MCKFDTYARKICYKMSLFYNLLFMLLFIYILTIYPRLNASYLFYNVDKRQFEFNKHFIN